MTEGHSCVPQYFPIALEFLCDCNDIQYYPNHDNHSFELSYILHCTFGKPEGH